jgi:[ribosomal protein S5]-alanine N-acetyltransferase
MSQIPTLYTPRLILRPFAPADAPRVQELAGDARVAATTLHIPHPYPDGAAESWIAQHPQRADTGEAFVFAITLAGTRTPHREHDLSDTGHLVGSIELKLDAHDVFAAELGYWIGAAYWNKGFATEASNAIIKFAFDRLCLARVTACHVGENPASGRVMQKIGMTRQPAVRLGEKNGRPLQLIDHLLTRESWSRKRIIHRWKPAPLSLVT